LLGQTSGEEPLPIQASDVLTTYAGVDDLMMGVEFKLVTSIDEWISRFVEGHQAYYHI
jgi:hypothetical protein